MAKTTYYWDDLSDNVVLEEDENGDPIAEYVQEPELYGEAISQQRDGQVRYYNYDGLGDTSELTDENQDVTDTYEYSAFGEEVAHTGATENPFRYKGSLGYYTDAATDEVYARKRTLEPAVARWLTTPASDSSMSSTNAFIYASNTPTAKNQRISGGLQPPLSGCVVEFPLLKYCPLFNCPYDDPDAACNSFLAWFDSCRIRFDLHSTRFDISLPCCPNTLTCTKRSSLLRGFCEGMTGYDLGSHKCSNPDEKLWAGGPPVCCHPSAVWCLRENVPPVCRGARPGDRCRPLDPYTKCQRGQQCCYDANGKLIVSGDSAGSPDLCAPAFSLERHNKLDVCFWACCKEAGRLEEWFRRVRPNQGCGSGEAVPSSTRRSESRIMV